MIRSVVWSIVKGITGSVVSPESTGSGETTDDLLLESADHLLLEVGDNILLENA